MEMSTIKVYVKLNENSEITSIGSSIFLNDVTDLVMIDEGHGDKYAHAQSQYLAKSLMDEQGRYNYKLVDGAVIEVAEEDKPVIEIAPQITIEDRVSAVENVVLEMIMGGMV